MSGFSSRRLPMNKYYYNFNYSITNLVKNKYLTYEKVIEFFITIPPTAAGRLALFHLVTVCEIYPELRFLEAQLS